MSSLVDSTISMSTFMWLLLLDSFFLSPPLFAFTLEGSPTSFVRYPKWYHAFENVLSFEFKTEKENGLLLYTDDGGNSNFYEISLHNGKLQLQFKIGRRNNAKLMQPHIIELSLSNQKSLSDGDWHKVELFQFWERVKLTLDGRYEYLTLEQQDFVFGNYETNSDVFIGGIPEILPTDQLSFKGVKGTERFAGSIRNLVYRTLPHGVTAPHILDSAGLRESEDNYCLQHVCANNGICYSTDDGAKCECTSEFEGQKCEFERGAHEATFLGSEFLSYDFTSNRNGFLSREEQVTLSFKTRRPSGMLFYSGDNQDYLHLAIKDGAIVATSNLGGGSKDVRVVPFTSAAAASRSLRFNDNEWHYVVLHRRLTTHTKGLNYLHLSVNVDGIYSDVKQTVGQYELLSSTVAYVGGKPKNKFIAQVLEDSSFVGCLTKVRFRADSRRLDFLDLAKRNDNFVRVYGNMTFMCREPTVPEPITFKRSQSYLILPSWQGAKSGSLSFKFKTNEPDGLILYNNGPGRNESDFFAIELVDGQLYLIINLGTGTLRLQASDKSVKDRMWHTVDVVRENRNGKITLDEMTTDFSTAGPAAQLDLGGVMYLGGYPPKINMTPSVWTKSLDKTFVGCLRDLNVNGVTYNLADFLVEKSHGEVELGCAEMLPQCHSGPCHNGGSCSEGWNRYWCDCSSTQYVGAFCDRQPVVVTFLEGQFVRVYGGRQLTEVEDIEVKFRTRKPSGMLISTSSNNAPDRVELKLSNGQLEYQINFGQKLHTFFWGMGLSDDKWHTVKIRRRALKLELYVDDDQPIIREIPPSQHIILEHDSLWAGNGDSNNLGNSIFASYAVGFQGQMAAFTFNGMNVFAKASEERSGDSILNNGLNVTATIGANGILKENPISFTSRRAFVMLQQKLLFASAFHIVFQFRTLEPNGLIIYGMGKSKDFLAVELNNGKLRYIFNAGDGPEFITSNVEVALNDFEWHLVFVHKVNAVEHILTVDGHTQRLRTTGASKELNLKGALYFGGVEKANYTVMPSSVTSRYGFRGCLASLAINGAAQDLLSEAVLKEDVKAGCDGPVAKCKKDSCANGGLCLQQWQSFSCDCSMTTYSGPQCADDSIGYQFGPSPGVVTYTFEENERPSVTDDLLALALVTNQSKATVMRVESITSSDFLSVQLEDGYATVKYDVGSGINNLVDLLHRVNDGEYHIIRLVRNGKNSTFQVDNNDIIMRTPMKKGELEVFNNQYQIQLGGRLNPMFYDRKRRSLKNRVDEPFYGVLSGVFYNGLKVLDKLAEKDYHVKAEGDVSYYQRLLTNVGPSTPKPYSISDKFLPLDGVGISSLEPNEGDEFILSGDHDTEASGCLRDSADEEECVIEEASTADIITPIVEHHITTRKTTTTTTTTTTTITTTPEPTTTYLTTTALEELSTTEFEMPEPFPPVECQGNNADCDNDESDVEVKEEWTTTTTAKPIEVAVPPAVPNQPKMTPPPLPRPTAGPYNPSDSKVTESSSPAETKPFPRTSVIAGVAVALIVVLIVVVFIVFKCRNKTSDSYSVDEAKTYTTLYTSGADVPGNKPLVNTKVSQANGLSRTGKAKKDVKEWYV